jgi:hypothetical protein
MTCNDQTDNPAKDKPYIMFISRRSRKKNMC